MCSLHCFPRLFGPRSGSLALPSLPLLFAAINTYYWIYSRPLIRQIVLVYALAFVAHSSTFITIRIHSGPKPNTAPNTEPSRADQAEASRVARGVSSTSKKVLLFITCWPRQEKLLFGQHLSRELLTHGHKNPAVGFFGSVHQH